MRRTYALLLLLFVCACCVNTSSLAATIAPYVGFGGADGWLAPGEGGYAYLGTGNNERGLAFGNGHLYLVSRTSVAGNTSNIRILDQTTGSDLGGLNTAAVTGGTFTVSTAAVGGDGIIYAANLTTQSTTTAFKVYSWATEGSVAAVAYTGDAGLAGSRAGDDLALVGSGSSTRLAAGYGSSPAPAGASGYAIIDPTAGTATAVGFVGTPPNAGDLRLGITFADSSHVLGTAGSSLYRYTSFSGASGTLIGSPAIPDPSGATADRLLARTVIGGISILAVQSIGDSHVTIYDITNPAVPVYLASGNNTSGPLTLNGNGTGQMAWGATTVNGDGTISRILYGMSTNQGIQAFVVTIPEPAAFSLVALFVALAGFFRRRRPFSAC